MKTTSTQKSQKFVGNTNVMVGNIAISNDKPFVLIAGPCALESAAHGLECAEAINKICQSLNIQFIFKASFDKANRTSTRGMRGLGLEASMNAFANIKAKIGCPVITDVHEQYHCQEVAQVVDILQIPALLCRQTDLIESAARTGRVINIKKGQFMAPWDIQYAAEKAAVSGNKNILLTERGSSFGYNKLVNDMRSLPIMAQTGCPVVFDASHSVQEPSSVGGSSGGQREFIKPLAQAAIAIGIAALFLETHPNPDSALSDGPSSLPLAGLQGLLTHLKAFDSLQKSL